MLQERWESTYAPDIMSEYSGKSYWLCTENWPNQNYPKDTSVYYRMGGFSNGYVPLFIVVGFQNRVYWDGNSSNFEAALQLAINEMATEGVYVDNPFEDQTMMFDDNLNFDVSGVFADLADNPVTVTIENNSNPEIVTATVENNILYLTASSSSDGNATVTLKGTAGEYSEVNDFTVRVYDPANFITEDFETGDFSKMPWESGGDMPWTIDPVNGVDGSGCAKSGAITHAQKSQAYVEVNFPAGGRIMFNYRLSSESGYDNLKFYVDDVEKRRWSGLINWSEYELKVEPGNHTFKWSYEKDASMSGNSDCVWIDNVVFEGGTTGITEFNLPVQTVLYQNYPNPFNPSTSIRFDLSARSEVNLNVYNYSGQLVRSLVEGEMNAGIHAVNFDASDLSAGVYYYTLKTDNNSYTNKMILLK